MTGRNAAVSEPLEVGGKRSCRLAFQDGDRCQSRGAGSALDHVVATGTLVAVVRLAAIMAGGAAPTVRMHSGMHVSLSTGLHHVAETRLNRLSCDHEYQDGCQ